MSGLTQPARHRGTGRSILRRRLAVVLAGCLLWLGTAVSLHHTHHVALGPAGTNHVALVAAQAPADTAPCEACEWQATVLTQAVSLAPPCLPVVVAPVSPAPPARMAPPRSAAPVSRGPPAA